MIKSSRIAISLIVVLALGGCASSVATHQQAVSVVDGVVKVPKKYRSSFLGGEVQDGWIKRFGDSKLNYLVKEAQKRNPDLEIAASKVERAIANMQITHSGMIPHLDLKGNYSYRSWEASKHHDKGDISLSLNWEPDLWGRVANELQSDSDYTVATMADFAWARQVLSANVARAWFLLNADNAIYRFNKEVVRIQTEARDILKKRAKIGQGNLRDVHLISGMLAEALDSAQAAKIAKESDIRALEVLVGRYPATKIKPRRLSNISPMPRSGVPLDLLNRRADIIAARYKVASAFHNVKATELLKLPRIDISVNAGEDIIQHTMAKLIGGLFMPIFDAGKIDAMVAKASSDQKRAIAEYKKVVLRAFREVEDSLAKDRQLYHRYRYAIMMVKEYKMAYDMTYKNYKIGQGTLLDVLNVQTKWINAKILKTQIQKERLINRVNLYLALGGNYKRK